MAVYFELMIVKLKVIFCQAIEKHFLLHLDRSHVLPLSTDSCHHLIFLSNTITFFVSGEKLLSHVQLFCKSVMFQIFFIEWLFKIISDEHLCVYDYVAYVSLKYKPFLWKCPAVLCAIVMSRLCIKI